MNKWQQRIKPWLVNHLALPSDTMLELPRITVIGHLHVYIENHKGLVVYTEKELTLKTNHGHIKIQGHTFVIKMMLPEEILLEGTIQHISLIES
ncbi:sporulation protein YqfC [Lentibacillus saliphilus]|uniref:sporulation protein YqfC n=1 Tax=Lentibacillus saliphilus TaxID=2737028 RepID=UPI001C2F2884|nr:sporulation protein YqfC [Lentibacillus saliphilus]